MLIWFIFYKVGGCGIHIWWLTISVECQNNENFYDSVVNAFTLCTLQMETVFTSLDEYSEEEKLQRLLKLKLRYFTPREVANLMGFPQSFCKSKIYQPLKGKGSHFLTVSKY